MLKTIYISHNGNDANNGLSLEHPLKSVEAAFHKGFDHGYHLLFEGGYVYNGYLLFKNLEGIQIASYGIGHATIHSGNQSGFVFEKCRNVTVSGIRFEGSGWRVTCHNSAIFLRDCEHVLIENIEAFHYNYAGINGEHCKNMKIFGCFVHDCGYVGIRSGGHEGRCENIHVAHCKAYDIVGDRLVMGNHSGSGIIIDGTKHGLVEFCEAGGTGWGQRAHSACGPVGIWACCGCDDVVFRYCISRYNRTQPGSADGDGFDFDGGVKNSVMEYNYSYGNEAAGYFFCEYGAKYYAEDMDWENNTVRCCVSFNDATRTGGYGPFSIYTPPSYPLGKGSIEKSLLIGGEKSPAVKNRIMPEGNKEVVINDNVLVTDDSAPITELNDKTTIIQNNIEFTDNAFRNEIIAHAPLLSNPRDLLQLPVYKMLEDKTCGDVIQSKRASELFGEIKLEIKPQGNRMFLLRMDGLDFDGCDRTGDVKLYYDSIKPGICTSLTGKDAQFIFPIPYWSDKARYVIRAKARLQSPDVKAALFLRGPDGCEQKAYFTGSVADYNIVELDVPKLDSGKYVGVRLEGGSGSVLVDFIEMIEVKENTNYIVKHNSVSDLNDFTSFGDCEQVKEMIQLNGMGSAIMRTVQKSANKVVVTASCKAEACKGLASIVYGNESKTAIIEMNTWQEIELSVESETDAMDLRFAQLSDSSGKLYVKEVRITEEKISG